MSKDGILIRKIKNFNINSNNYNKNINISQKLSTAIPMNKLRDKLKNKHIMIIIKKIPLIEIKIYKIKISQKMLCIEHLLKVLI